MPSVRLRFIGPDRFCPDCGRWLVRTHDGDFTLAAKATALSSGFVADSDWHTGEAEHVITDAICLRRVCRIKRAVRQLPSLLTRRYTRR